MELLLFGEFQLLDAEGSLLTITSKKSRALMAYLGTTVGKPTPRDKLAELLWSCSEREFGRNNLRQSLSILRKNIQHQTRPVLVNQGDSLLLEPAGLTVDVSEFERCADSNSIKVLEEASNHYCEDLMLGFQTVDPAFDDWLISERSRLRERHITILQQLINRHQECANHSEVDAYASRLLNTDLSNESAHRAKMQLYWHNGDRQSALRQFKTCQTVLKAELDIDPSNKTVGLYNLILREQSAPKSTRASNIADKVSVENKQQLDANPILTADSLNQHILNDSINSPSSPVQKLASGKRFEPFDAHTTSRRGFLHLFSFSACLVLLLGALLVIQLWEPAKTSLISTSSALEENELTATGGKLTSLSNTGIQKSIAVMPFRNLSDDQEDLYFSDGLSEDISGALSRISGLNVISSQSSFFYRDQQNDISAMQSLLPIDFLLTGSVRRKDQTVRVTAQLIRLTDSVNVWSTKIDRPVSDVLALQDEITSSIVGSLSVKLTESERQYLSHNRTVRPEAYDMLLRGLHPFSQFTDTGINQARNFFEKSIELDSSYARPYANMALSYGREVVFQLEAHDPQLIHRGLEYAAQAEALDPLLPQTQFARAVLNLANHDHQRALLAARRSIALDGNYADGYAVLSQVSAYAGDLDTALESINIAQELNPVVPFMYRWVEGHVLYHLGRYADAKDALIEVYDSNPTFYLGLVTLTAAYGQLGMKDEAEWLREEILVLRPTFSAQQESKSAPYLFDQLRSNYLIGMQKAGLPD